LPPHYCDSFNIAVGQIFAIGRRKVLKTYVDINIRNNNERYGRSIPYPPINVVDLEILIPERLLMKCRVPVRIRMKFSMAIAARFQLVGK
jgi:hypothetical protein